MGGSSSRELSKRGSKRKRMKEQSGQHEVCPTDNYYSRTGHFSFDGHNTGTCLDHRTGINQFQDNRWEHEDFSNSCGTGSQREFTSENRNRESLLGVGEFGLNFENCNNFLQRSSNDTYEERQFRRPIRRHHSFNENRFQFQNSHGSMQDFRPSQIRCNSMIDINDRDYLFEGQYMGNRFTNFSSCNLSEENHPFGRTSPYDSSRYNAKYLVRRGGTEQCYSYNDQRDDVYWNHGSNGASEEILVFDSPVKPRVKRRQSDESKNVDILFGNNMNRSKNERCHSGLSFHSKLNTTENYAVNDIVRSLSDEPCGALALLSFPSEWSSRSVDKTGYVNISFSSAEGKSVQRFFQRTCKSKDSHLSICGIIRIENPFLHTLYMLKKEEMLVRNGHVDELFLYHGTKKRNVPNICENNLNWRQYSDMHRFGKGVSFSPTATYSSHYSDEIRNDKVLLLFKVLVSNTVLGSSEMNIPQDDEGVSYDTSIKEDASVIVKYCDNEFYPLYKILYQKV